MISPSKVSEFSMFYKEIPGMHYCIMQTPNANSTRAMNQKMHGFNLGQF